jgi:hypothetical protein
VPRAHELERQALELHTQGRRRKEEPKREPAGDADRDDRERQGEQHRGEHELRRNGDSRADLELHAGDERVRDDECGHLQEGRRPRGREQGREPKRDAEERSADDERRLQVTVSERARTTRPGRFDQARVFGREDDLRSHGPDFGTAQVLLDRIARPGDCDIAGRDDSEWAAARGEENCGDSICGSTDADRLRGRGGGLCRRRRIPVGIC